MFPKYMRLRNDDTNEEIADSLWDEKHVQKKPTRSALLSIIILLLIINGTTWLYWFSTKPRTEPTPRDYALQDSLSIDTTWNRFWWNTEYSPKNHSESDELWDAILPSHGFIAMNEDWAFDRHWPDSMRLPSDATKRVYLLEAYHQLHCL
ncbi:MAG: hypothetical protein Q9225_008082, partial [Loekoesia sp. 1 TL-2023]